MTLELPSQPDLWEMFSYDPLNGHLYWRQRDSIRKSTRLPAGGIRQTGYRAISIRYKRYLHHRLVWSWFYGDIPAGYQIDHKDRNKANDRIDNLRLATPAQNNINQGVRADSKSKYTGIHWYKTKQKWQVYTTIKGVRKHLGYYQDLDSAVKARNKALHSFTTEDAMFLPTELSR
jgi:hypothetical protein